MYSGGPPSRRLLAADSRTNAGVDQIATVRKLALFDLFERLRAPDWAPAGAPRPS